ncbi:MAG: cytochrome P450, partial [Brevundimonas sp.]
IQSFPITRTCPLEPPPIYSELRLEGPLAKVELWNGAHAWLVTRFEDVRSVLLDKRFSESPDAEGYPMLSPARASLVSSDAFMTHMVGDEHKAMRRALSRELSVKRVEEQRPIARQIVHDLIDEMIAKGQPADLVADLALQLPMRVIAGMLGVPYEDHAFFEENSQARVALDVEPHVPIEATKALADYFSVRLAEKEANPTDEDDMLMRFARDHVNTGGITHRQAVNLSYTVVQAGHETTANMIALGVLLLLNNPDQLKAIADDPSLVKGAVEEMLRYLTILQLGMARTALEDVEVGGQMIRKGEGLFAMLISANFDPAAFGCPEKFDITRPERNHVAFSYGVHQCAGQQLARMEMQELFSILFQRLPDLKVAIPFEDISFKHKNIVFGIDKLPVVW